MKRIPFPSADSTDSDAGFGLIEIIVAMFLLAIIAIAFIPVLIQGMRLSVTNATTAAATQLVSSNIEDARSRGPLCANVAAFANDPSVASMITPAGHGVNLVVHRTPLTCPTDASAYPGTVAFSVYVTTTTDSTTKLAQAKTLIFVSAAS